MQKKFPSDSKQALLTINVSLIFTGLYGRVILSFGRSTHQHCGHLKMNKWLHDIAYSQAKQAVNQIIFCSIKEQENVREKQDAVELIWSF